MINGAASKALLLTMYPAVSDRYNRRHQSQIQTAYREILEQTDSAELARVKEQANAYNLSIKPGAMGEAYSPMAILAASENYVNQLNIDGNGIMGYIEIPKIRVDLPIYHGTEPETLDKGVGHLLGSSLPVGGESTHAILSGHSGMASQKMFTDLEQLQEGDVFYLHVLGETLAYQVDAIHTVLPQDTTYLGIVQGEDLCTLVTCTPTWVNTHRLLVRGSRIFYEQAVEGQGKAAIHEEIATTSHWEEQYWFGIRLGVEIFDLNWVQAVVNLFTMLGWSLFAVGVVAVFEVAIESQSGRVNVKRTALNVLKGFFGASLVGILPVQLYKTCCTLQGMFTADLTGIFAGEQSSTIGAFAGQILSLAFDPNAAVQVGLKLIFFLLAFAYCVIKVFFVNIKRGGILLIQIAVGSLYLFGVPRWYTDGFYQWCKQVAAISF